MFNGCITSLAIPSKKHSREESFILEHIDFNYVEAVKRRRAQEISKTVRAPPAPAFNNLFPRLTYNLEMSSIRKRSRTKSALPPPAAGSTTQVWTMTSVIYDNDRAAVVFNEPVARQRIKDTLAVFDMDCELEGDMLTTLPMTKSRYAIAQARGFAKMFEITSKSAKEGDQLKTVPLTPILLRWLVTSTMNDEVDKWNVFAAAHVLTNWVLRRFMRKAVNIQAMMLSVRSARFTEHYLNLPGVTAVVQRYLNVVQEGSVGAFINDSIVGWSLIFSFLAVKHVDRIHCRFLEEARHLGEIHGRDFVRDHHEFYSLINKLRIWTTNYDHLQTTLIMVPPASAVWDIDVEELCVLTYKTVQDTRVDPLSAVAMMLSLLSSLLDNGEVVRYLDNIVTMRVFQLRKFTLLEELMVGRDPSERQSVEEQMNRDIRETDVYNSRIYYEVHSAYKKKIPTTREYKGRLGRHCCSNYDQELVEASPLYGDVQVQRAPDRELLPLFSVVACIENYYTSSESKPIFSLDFHRAATSSTHLLPVYNNQVFLDRVFFHV